MIWAASTYTVHHVPQTSDKGIYVKLELNDKLIEHKHCIAKYGADVSEIRSWKWGEHRS